MADEADPNAAKENAADPAAAVKPPGFLARLTGTADELEQVRGELKAEKEAHAITTGKLQVAEGQIKAYGEMEAKAEEKFNGLTKERDDAKAEVVRLTGELATAKQEAANAKATAEKEVAGKVKDTVAGLGVDPETLPAAKSGPDKPGEGGEFSELKGRARAVAAFNAQFAN